MSAISAGSKVKLHGLKTPTYNNKQGICLGNNDAGRYIVEVQGVRIAVKRENIIVLPTTEPAYSFASAPGTAAPDSDAAAWAKGLDAAAAAEWFVDCYRMRLDDTYALQGDLCGLYDPDHESEDILRHFLLFCKMAVRNEVVPEGFDWQLCFERFGDNLNYAFEKQDAKEKYGSENYFSAMMGGRSLRFTGQIATGQKVDSGEYEPGMREETERLHRLIQRVDWEGANRIFENVGGWRAWSILVTKVK